MVISGEWGAAVSIAGDVLPLCATGAFGSLRRSLGVRQIGAWRGRFVSATAVGTSPQRGGHMHNPQTRLRVFVWCHGFLLIIRGFVKVAVCNAGVIHQ